MQSIDPKLQSAVWSRVQGTPCPEEAAKGGVVSAEEVLQWMQDERDGCAVLQYLAGKACGKEAAQLRQMAARRACHYRKLHTMYYLLTGQCVHLTAAQPDCTACLSEALRTAYQEERQRKQRYEQAADRWPAMADEFYRMAADDDCNSRRIRAMLCNRLS